MQPSAGQGGLKFNKGMNKVEERGMIDLVLEKTLESPLDWKDIKPVSLKGHPP